MKTKQEHIHFWVSQADDDWEGDDFIKETLSYR
jgi:hypothetical protein